MISRAIETSIKARLGDKKAIISFSFGEMANHHGLLEEITPANIQEFLLGQDLAK